MADGQPQLQPVAAPALGPRPTLGNWIGTIHYQPARYVKVRSIAEIQAIVRDTAQYPAPVRVKGSHHSMSRCIVAEHGTVIDVSGLDRILRVDAEAQTITLEAGVKLLAAAKLLERMGLQFYVNVELGALTLGSAACCATKDASCYSVADESYEFGQASSYAIGFKLIDHLGNVVQVDEQHQPELLPLLRSSYGLLGVVCEVTFRIKPLAPLRFAHTEYRLDELTPNIDQLFDSRDSHMLYLFPFLDRVVVERRAYSFGEVKHENLRWQLRNALRKAVPALARLTQLLPERARSPAIDTCNRALITLMTSALHGDKSSAADQIIDYRERPGRTGYAFSIWAFPLEAFASVVREYFAFCRAYYARTGFRCDLPNVGYGVRQDRSALFSYSRMGHVFTLDPVCSTPGPDWDAFIVAYNEFCSQYGGWPLLNQTSGLTPVQMQQAFGPQIAEFLQVRSQLDPTGRFYNAYFRELFEANVLS